MTYIPQTAYGQQLVSLVKSAEANGRREAAAWIYPALVLGFFAGATATLVILKSLDLLKVL